MGSSLQVDGFVGPMTLEVIAAARDEGKLDEIKDLVVAKRQACLKSRPHAKHFPGWWPRLDDL